ncbi:MAG: PAS domain-containing protein, partial [Acidobacteria bacterium]|nr:PAS domain-containing protein [Acidobacteriota bacterium]
YFTLGFAAGAAVLVYSRMHSESAEQRQQLKWIVRTALLGLLPFAVFYALPFALGSIPSRLQEASVLSLAIIPMGFAYAIVKYRLMDVDVIFKRGAAYFVASAAVLAVYFVVVLFAGRVLLAYFPNAGLLLFALAALVAAFLFRLLHGTVQGALDRLFYTEQYDYRRSFSDFGKTLSSEISLERLSSVLLQRLQKTMNVDQAALMIRQNGNRYFIYDTLRGSARNESFHFPEGIFQDCDRELRPLYLAAGTDQVRVLRESLHVLDLYYVQPLLAHDGAIALLALGKRRNGEGLSSEDLDLLQAISRYAAIAIENATLYRNVESKAGELEQLKVFSEGIVESIEAGVLTVDPEGKISSLNSGMEKLLACSRREHLGKPLDSLLPARLLERVRTATEGRWVVTEALHFYKVSVPAGGERTRVVNLHFTPFVSRHDIVAGTLVVMEDVTQKVQLEDQLIQAEKLTSLGLLAAGVAHEVNTPLAGISSYTQMLLKDLPRGHPQRPILEKIERQTFRASEIVNNLLKFARLGGGELRQVNLNHLVLETLSLLDHQLKRQNIAVSASLDPGLPAAHGNDGKLQQVFMNILLNAKDAMPDGGRLEVRTQARDNGVMVVIRDTGVGISKENIKKIYDPFFTTKEVVRGTGQGLSISYGIIQEHSGNIHVESEPGKGTEFTLQFPVRRVH